jgi:predicted component of type VI protein secretion system
MEAMIWRLVVVEGEDVGSGYDLGARTTMGREEGNDVKVGDPMSSRQHALIERVGDAYQITDLGSSNGTLVNGVRISTPVALKPRDRIQIGNQVYQIQAPEPAVGAAATMVDHDPARTVMQDQPPVMPGSEPAPRVQPPMAATMEEKIPSSEPPGAFVATGDDGQGQRSPWTWVGIGCGALIVLIGSAACCYWVIWPQLQGFIGG